MELLLPREKTMGSESQNRCGGQGGKSFEGSQEVKKHMVPLPQTNETLLTLAGGAWEGWQHQLFLQLE